ncbi:MAG: tetratricopeptide repeat protein [Planctomycetota bacterium]
MSSHLAAAEERAHRSALVTAEARAEAEHAQLEANQQRGARRLSLLLAASVLVLLLVGGGGYSFLARAERERARVANGAVADALREAQRLRGEELWEPAQVAAQQVRELAEVDGVDGSTRVRALRAAGAIGTEAEQATQALARKRREDAFVARLESIRLRRGDSFDSLATDADYADAFVAFGLDVEAAEPAALAERIRQGSRALEIATALDDWAWLRRSKKDLSGRDWERLAATARLADPDPWRNRLRTAMETGDLAALRTLAKEADESLAVRSVDLLGLALEEAGDSQAAVDLLRRFALRHPTDFWLHYHLASWHTDLDPPDGQGAVRFARSALALRPDSAAAWTRLGLAFEAAKQPDAARRAFEKALAVNPAYSAGRNSYALFLEHSGALDEAIEQLRHGIRVDASIWAFYANLRLFHEMIKKDVNAAVATLRSYPDDGPSWSKARHALGNLYSRHRRYAEAIVAYRQVLDRKPGNSGTHCMLGIALLETDRLDDAEKHLRESIRLRPTPSAHGELGRVFFRKGKDTEAIAEYRMALDLDAQQPFAHHNIGTYHLARGEWSAAAREFELELKVQPDLTETHFGLAQTQYLAGDIRNAVKTMRRATELGSKRTNLLRKWENHLALLERFPALLSGKDRLQSAEQAAELALVLYLKKRHAAAAKQFLDAFEQRPALLDGLGHRHNAACAAVLAGTGQGVDAADLDETSRKAWRARAYSWKRADLEACRAKSRAELESDLRHWQVDPDLAFVRAESHLAKLPAPEAKLWRAYWRDVQAALDG